MYRYFQPTYVKDFICDGKKCGAHCCRAGWTIEIDDDTHKKYSSMVDLPQHFAFNEQLNKYCIAPNEQGVCPYLDADQLCSIQRTYGEAFLSETCRQYPRQTLDFGEYYERSLSLVCPIASDMILNSARIEFEWLEVDERVHRQSEIFEPNVPIDFWSDFVAIQREAIAILQRRSLSISDRLLELGNYLAQFDSNVRIDEDIYRVPASIDDIMLENYLVHEFFINTYPWRFELPIEFNLAIYLLNVHELIHRAPILTVEAIREFVVLSNHDMDYISEQLKRLQLS